MAATTAAVVGAAAAAKGASDSNKAAKESNKIQEEQGQASREYIEAQSGQARADAEDLFPAAELNLLAGQQAALDVFGQSLPQQMGAIRAGSDAARQAILGTGTGQVNFTPDMSFSQQVLPTLRDPSQRFGSAADIAGSPIHGLGPAPVGSKPEYMEGLETNADLLRAASTGKIPGVSAADQDFFGRWMREAATGHPELLVGKEMIQNPQMVIDQTVGDPGGMAAGGEIIVANLLKKVLNPYQESTAASKFLGGY